MIRRVDPPPTSPLVRELAEKQGIGWFDAVCAVLKRENRPTVHTTWEVFGKPELPTPRHRRFYQRLIPFDRRFDEVGLLPDIDETAPDAPLDSLFFVGGFSLTVGDIARRFPRFKKQFNGYDGGTQIFFIPSPANTNSPPWTSGPNARTSGGPARSSSPASRSASVTCDMNCGTAST